MSDIGGILGLWFGISSLTMVEFMVLIFDCMLWIIIPSMKRLCGCGQKVNPTSDTTEVHKVSPGKNKLSWAYPREPSAAILDLSNTENQYRAENSSKQQQMRHPHNQVRQKTESGGRIKQTVSIRNQICHPDQKYWPDSLQNGSQVCKTSADGPQNNTRCYRNSADPQYGKTFRNYASADTQGYNQDTYSSDDEPVLHPPQRSGSIDLTNPSPPPSYSSQGYSDHCQNGSSRSPPPPYANLQAGGKAREDLWPSW